jgi:methylmalonyl-CoA mutase
MAPENGKEQNGQGTRFFEDFPVPSYDEWYKVTEESLKGASFEKKLISRTYEGIDLQPMYRQEDAAQLPHKEALPGFAPYVRGNTPLGYVTNPWKIAQEFAYATPEACNEAIQIDMQRGQNSVSLKLDRATLTGSDPDQAETEDVGNDGVSIASISDLATVLDGIDLKQTPLFLNAETTSLPITALLLALLRQRGVAPEQLRGAIEGDPLGALARTGSLPAPMELVYTAMAHIATWASQHAPHLKTINVHSHPYHDSGGNATQELAFAIATGTEYVRSMLDRGLSIEDVAGRMRFSFSAGAHFFIEVAKLRAARLLWSQVIQAFGGSDEAQKLTMHVRTSSWNKTFYDPYVNMLRTTTEALSGIVGGCDSMHVGCFDEAIRQPDFFSRRIARNTHLILQQESHFDKLVDPVGGSWYVEHLTDALARNAWSLFQEVEQQGGMFSALQAGFPQAQTAEVAAQRQKNIARRRDVFVGTNMYPNLKEKPLEVHPPDHAALKRERTEKLAQHRASVDQAKYKATLEKLAQAAGAADDTLMELAIEAAQQGATVGELARALRPAGIEPITITPLNIHRGTEPFEALRKASEAYQAQHGNAPRVFLANMGPIPQHKPRADFTTGFFQVGGFEVLTNQGFATPEEAAAAATESGASIVVICSTDATYPDLVPPVTQQIKAAKPDTTVILAGYPKDQVEAHKAAGVDDFIYLGANVYDLLLNLQQKLGVV